MVPGPVSGLRAVPWEPPVRHPKAVVFRRSKTDSSPATPGPATGPATGTATTSRRSRGSTAYRPGAPAGGSGGSEGGSDVPVQLGKGRPTPSRKEAEAAARARAKAALDPKLTRKQERERRFEASRAAREGIKSGDERYLRPRDQGPVRRFVRDFVDQRLNLGEFAIPLLFASLMFSAAGYARAGTGIMNALLLMVIVDSVVLRWRLHRELRRRFPDESTKGVTFYAFMRALQLRFLRLPKPQVRLGQRLPERY